MRVAATEGLQAVSLRLVAREAGVSTGMVQHYFRTKDEMMSFALTVVGERVDERLAEKAAAEGSAPPWEPDGSVSPGAVVRDILIEMLPLDEARHREGQVGLAFHAYAAVRPRAAAQLHADTEQLEAFLADRIRQAQHRGESPEHLRPEHEARMLLALVEGLSMHVLGQGYDAGAARDTFETQLHRVFPLLDATDAGSA